MRRSAFKRDADRNATFGVQNFERPFTPRGWLRSASNFAKTRFRRFPTFHFSTSGNFSDAFFSKIFGVRGKILRVISSFRKSLDFLSITIKFYWKNDPISPKVQVCTFLGEGVEGQLKFFFLDLGPKLTYSFCSMGHMMIWCYDDMML